MNNPLNLIDPFGSDWFFDDELQDWVYELDASFIIDVVADYETGETDTKIRTGVREFAIFNGAEFKWYERSGRLYSWPAVSGLYLENGKSRGELQQFEDVGPIPEGEYILSPKKTYNFYYDLLYGNEKIRNFSKWIFEYNSWGFYKTQIIPNSDTRNNIINLGRKPETFYLHGGTSPGSRGCIDLTNWNNQFHTLFYRAGRNLNLIVNYE